MLAAEPQDTYNQVLTSVMASLPELIPLEHLRSHSLLIASETLNGRQLLIHGQRVRAGRRVRENKPECDAHKDGE